MLISYTKGNNNGTRAEKRMEWFRGSQLSFAKVEMMVAGIQTVWSGHRGKQNFSVQIYRIDITFRAQSFMSYNQLITA